MVDGCGVPAAGPSLLATPPRSIPVGAGWTRTWGSRAVVWMDAICFVGPLCEGVGRRRWVVGLHPFGACAGAAGFSRQGPVACFWWSVRAAHRGCVVGFFQVSVPASRRARIRAGLPTMCPAGWEALAAAVAGLPDPAVLGADELCGSLIAAGRLRNQVDAYLCGLAGAADVVQASRTLHAGTTGTLVSAATGCTPAAGSAVVATARALRGLPVVAERFRAGDLSAVHVSVITRAAGSIPGFTRWRTRWWPPRRPPIRWRPAGSWR